MNTGKQHTISEVGHSQPQPNKYCSGNQSVIAGVRIFDMISHIYP